MVNVVVSVMVIIYCIEEYVIVVRYYDFDVVFVFLSCMCEGGDDVIYVVNFVNGCYFDCDVDDV